MTLTTGQLMQSWRPLVHWYYLYKLGKDSARDVNILNVSKTWFNLPLICWVWAKYNLVQMRMGNFYNPTLVWVEGGSYSACLTHAGKRSFYNFAFLNVTNYKIPLYIHTHPKPYQHLFLPFPWHLFFFLIGKKENITSYIFLSFLFRFYFLDL